jgi:para-aminobenzoate synthetase/4-amino-4-deoxychorismate lyase
MKTEGNILGDTGQSLETGAGTVLLRDAGAPSHKSWIAFTKPRDVLRAAGPGEVAALLEEMERALGQGLYAAGFLSYEAAPAFDDAFTVHPACPVPVAWFGLYDAAHPIPPPVWNFPPISPCWASNINREDYGKAVERIREWIAAGDTYQVNFTTRLTSPFHEDPDALFAALHASQPNAYAAYVNTGDHAICSVSPELFFEQTGDRIVCRPMKGTVERGATTEEDRDRAAWLKGSEKNRAENIMIVDMIRNDLGRIAIPGTVEVPSRYDIERHDTLFQMTSTVEAQTGHSISEIFGALFPSASVTGAPKVRTMEIIRELEEAPRGVYTGGIGYAGPHRRARFSVAIRTVHVDFGQGIATYGTGSGIVWDSEPEAEFKECATKSMILGPVAPPFQLLESLRWDRQEGYLFLARHLERLGSSGAYFGFEVDTREALHKLRSGEESRECESYKVRLLAHRNGEIDVEFAPITDHGFRSGPGTDPVPRTACLAGRPVDRRNPFLRHKTTFREPYENAMAGCEGYDEVILWNENEELTETTIGNLVVVIQGDRLTPPSRCGLLAGTYRADLLEKRTIREHVLTIRDLNRAGEVYMINSVRGWVRLEVCRRNDTE